MFVTVWLGILDLKTGELTASNAGHEYPILKEPDGSFHVFKDRHGMPIGAFDAAVYRDYSLSLAPETALLVYTDGIPEAINRKNEQFGLDRALDTLNSMPSLNPERMIETVHKEVDSFAGNVPQFDDLTMLSLVWHGSENTEQ